MTDADIAVWWWREESNFGDALTPYLIRELFGLSVRWTPLGEADLVATGSLIQWISPTKRTSPTPLAVWGSGAIWDQEALPRSQDVRYYAVRGKKTRGLVPGGTNAALGDPGLLAHTLLTSRPIKRYRLGLVPHLWHRNNACMKRLEAEGAHVVDVRNDPVEVVKEMATCEVVASSSLHGLVVADSLDIPNVWIRSEPELFGNSWKFLDYYSAFDMTREPIESATFKAVQEAADADEGSFVQANFESLRVGLMKSFPFRP